MGKDKLKKLREMIDIYNDMVDSDSLTERGQGHLDGLCDALRILEKNEDD